uniref:Transposase n=1 Tax=Edwardsiella tarda TaxID=636 RepID=A0A2S1PMN1_EDWTA|nr:transposase [Edwardsiella tarda]
MLSVSSKRYSPELRERAVRMLIEQRESYPSAHAAIKSIAPKISCSIDTLHYWLRQHERDVGGGDTGLTTAERQRLNELEREIRELRRSNDILRQASAYFAKAEFDRLWKNNAAAGYPTAVVMGSDWYVMS